LKANQSNELEDVEMATNRQSKTEDLGSTRLGNLRNLGFVALAMLIALVVAGVSDAGTTSKNAKASSTATSARSGTPALVDEYEQHKTFRGVANGDPPKALRQGLHLGVAEVTFQSTTPGIRHDGYVDYGSVARDTDLIAASDGPTRDRFALILETARAPTKYTVRVTVPSASRVVNESSGAITISSPAGTTTTLAPASAIDATGRNVPGALRDPAWEAHHRG
jgi:hypothetical protein